MFSAITPHLTLLSHPDEKNLPVVPTFREVGTTRLPTSCEQGILLPVAEQKQ